MSRNVRAGNAYVELGIKAKFDRGLQAASKKLTAFGKTSLAVGGGVAAGVGAAFASVVAVGSKFASYGDVVGKMAKRTGVATASLQELAFAARQSGTDMETIEKGFFGLSRSVFDLSRGSGEAVDAYGRIGLAFKDLEGLSPEDQLQKVADAIANVSDESTRGAIAQKIFGRSGRQLLPLFREGPEGLAALRKEANSLGIVMSDVDISMAEKLTDSFGRSGDAVKGVFLKLGAVAAPALSRVFDSIAAGASYVNSFIESWREFAATNETLFNSLFAGAAVIGTFVSGLLTVGSASLALGIALPFITTGVGIVAGTITSFMGPAIAAAAAIGGIGFAVYRNIDLIKAWGQEFWELISPVRDAVGQIFGIVTSTFGGISDAITAGDYAGAVSILWAGIQAAFFTGAAMSLEAVSWLYSQAVSIFGSMVASVQQTVSPLFGFFTPIANGIGETFGGVFDWLAGALGGLYQNFQATFGGIASAIMAGDIGLAVDILWASIQLAFVAGTGSLASLWSSFTLGLKEVWSTMSSGIVSVFRGVVAAIAGAMQSMTDKMRSVLEAVAAYDPTGAAARIAKSLGTVSDFIGIAEDDLRARQKAAEEQRNREQLARGKAHLDDLQQIAKRTADAKAKRDELIDRANAAGGSITLGTLQDSSLDALQKKLAKAKSEAQIVMDDAKRSEVQETQAAATKRGSELAGKTKSSSVGSFSAIGASLIGLGGGSVAEKTATNTEKTATNTGQMLGHLKRLKSPPAPPAFGS